MKKEQKLCQKLDFTTRVFQCLKTVFFGMGLIIMVMLVTMPQSTYAQKKKKKEKEKDEIAQNDTLKSGTFSGLKFRSIGPAFTSGRIADFAVNPENPKEYFVAVACGHIWKTENSGTTWKAVFDNYGSYSIGCLAMDPNNSNVIWAGSGENNHQRALGYGDGVYKSIDGGKSWKNMGLKESRQIGKILINPCNSDIVYVAAEGSAWGSGGERGLYKTTDGGKNWELIKEISEHTGINDIVMDPRNPDVIYASSEQRRRHVHTKIGGGPETAIFKTTDGGENWKKLSSGLPGGDLGGIGLAISPVDPDVIYAIIEAEGGKGGFFRSSNRGESWSKRGDHHSSGQYYNEIYCDPVDVDKVYSVETVTRVTVDGGKTWKRLGNNGRHVDDHALWIDPDDTDHILIGGDGGVYESFDAGKNYLFKSNLPVTQYYRVNVDNSEPFYWVYGGTQDNSSMGGPSGSIRSSGVNSGDWKVTLGGDGFWQAIDPENPNIVYSEYQYGNIYRYDKKSGENIKIKPVPEKDEDTYKWNWNTPYILSPHSNTRLYIAANKVFRSDDRGNSWTKISEDITAQIDRNTWPVMDRYWGVDAIAKDVSTSLFGTAVSIDESPIRENLLYVGTDDGVIQVTEDAAGTWKKIDQFPGVPEYTYVSDIATSKFDANIVFASFDNRKRDDFKPYLLKSEDKGNTWMSIAGNLPENGTVHSIAQDFINPELLFAGTEFGVFFSIDGGKIWTQLKSGIPTIAVRDIAIQERECDLVLATFGRGFYILDNYEPLRSIDKEILDTNAHIFPVKDALMYIQSRGKYGQGSTQFNAPNPTFGAVFTYYIKETPKTLKAERKEKEKKLVKDKAPIPIPGMDELRAEENEIKPYIVFTIRDANGNIVNTIRKSPSKGIKRLAWDFRYPSPYPVRVSNDKYNPLQSSGYGIMAMPGTYNVTLSQVVRGEETLLAGPVEFVAKPLNNSTLPPADKEELLAFTEDISDLARMIRGTQQYANELMKNTQYIKQAIINTPAATPEMMSRATEMEMRLNEVLWQFSGQPSRASGEEDWPAPVPINERFGAITSAHWRSTAAVTQTARDQFSILEEEMPLIIAELRSIYEDDFVPLQMELDAIGAPWTPGRFPVWER